MFVTFFFKYIFLKTQAFGYLNVAKLSSSSSKRCNWQSQRVCWQDTLWQPMWLIAAHPAINSCFKAVNCRCLNYVTWQSVPQMCYSIVEKVFYNRKSLMKWNRVFRWDLLCMTCSLRIHVVLWLEDYFCLIILHFGSDYTFHNLARNWGQWNWTIIASNWFITFLE